MIILVVVVVVVITENQASEVRELARAGAWNLVWGPGEMLRGSLEGPTAACLPHGLFPPL